MNKRLQIRSFLGVILLLALLLSTCNPGKPPTTALTPITVQLQWTHQSEFAGYYAADQNGYYAEEGLAVTLVPGGVTVDHMSAIQEGSAQFGSTSADALISARAQGKTLKAIAAVYRRNPTVFLTLADSGITRPQEFAGKTIRSATTLAVTLHAMTAFVGVPASQYTEVTDLPSDVALFASGDVPVWAMFITGMAVAIKQAGIEVNIIYPDDYGVHFYGDVIVTTEEMIKDNPDLVLRFLRATLKGWTFAVENPEKIAAMVLKVDPNADPALEQDRMTTSLPLINTGEDHIGWMKAEIWANMESVLREQYVISAPMQPSSFYSMQFLQEIYGK